MIIPLHAAYMQVRPSRYSGGEKSYHALFITPPMGERGDGRSLLRPEYIRLIKIAIAAAVVIAAVAISLPFILQAIAQPNIAIIDPNFSRTGCGWFGTTQTYTYSFSLINTGDADGFVKIGFFVDSIEAGQATYFVPAGDPIPKVAPITVGGCDVRAPGMRILEVSKA